MSDHRSQHASTPATRASRSLTARDVLASLLVAGTIPTAVLALTAPVPTAIAATTATLVGLGIRLTRSGATAPTPPLHAVGLPTDDPDGE